MLYNCVLLLLGLLAFPFILWDVIHHKKYRKSYKQRLGIGLPNIVKRGKVIWIHTISVGETKAVIPLYEKLCTAYPEATFVISTTTETGQAEAKRSLSGAAAYFYLPLDFSFLMRKAMKQIKPDLLILVESDLWYHLLKYAKEAGALIFLVNGKLSQTSTKRYQFFKPFAKGLLSFFDHICVQSETHKNRFIQIGAVSEKVTVTGNLKFDHIPERMAPSQREAWRASLGIASHEPVLVIGSTHSPEEEWILDALAIVFEKIPKLKVILVPRHPERFGLVAEQMRNRKEPVLLYSTRHERRGSERLILIDAMGLLMTCYQLADLAIVAGSFVTHVGGHNIFEPVSCGVPVIFGPHMQGQQDLKDAILSSGAGIQTTLEDLPRILIQLYTYPSDRERYAAACREVICKSQGSAKRTLNLIVNNSP